MLLTVISEAAHVSSHSWAGTMIVRLQAGGPHRHSSTLGMESLPRHEDCVLP